jgi:type II restriction enzyme
VIAVQFEDLRDLYIEKKKQFGKEAYTQIPQLLEEAEVIHRKDWDKCPTEGRDYGQSWRSFKGKNLQKLIQYIITDEIEELGLKVVNGDSLGKTKNLEGQLKKVKRDLLLDYGEYGCHLPDVDIIVYHPDTSKVLAIISSKVSLRERIAQTGYWKLKLLQDGVTEHIKVYLISPDKDDTLKDSHPPKKARAITGFELDGAYLLKEAEVPDTGKIKLFKYFVEDLEIVLDNSEGD